MKEVIRLKQEAGALVEAVGEVLDAYLRLDAALFSWKNTFGWNDVSSLRPQVPVLVEKLSVILERTRAGREATAALAAEMTDRPLLEQFYRDFGNYADALRLAIQGTARIIEHVETRRTNRDQFKKVRYESDLMIYKSQVDKYQLYGQQLNPLLTRLRA